MQGSEFRRWAEHGTRHYGDDPWQFLRELLQNARDAGARHVDVRTSQDPTGQVLSFADDGSGMRLEHARRYLFRLYASSKDPRQDSAGEFGIGFWTVLRFKPEQLVVESRAPGDAGWGVRIDAQFALEVVAPTLARVGTRITLRRPPPAGSSGALHQEVRRALEHYGRCLTVRRQPQQPLRITLDGEPVAQGLALESPLSLRFRDGAVEGVVGLAAQPSVTLYARGLPVWQGTVLDELRTGLPRRRFQGEVAQGLAPAFQLNGLRLRVDVQRRGVQDDRHLLRLHRAAQRALTRLVRTHLRTSVLASPWARLAARARALWADELRPSLGPLMALAAALLLLGGALWWARPRWQAPARIESIGSAIAPVPAPAPVAEPLPVETPGSPLPERYFGAVVDGVAPVAPLLRYRPPRTLWFRVLVVESHDVERGFVGDALAGPRSPYPDWRCQDGCVEVALDTPPRGWLVVPVPPGFAVDAASVQDSQDSAPALWRSARGEVLLERSTPGTRVRYTVGPRLESAQLTTPAKARALQLPAHQPWPEAWRRELRQGRHAPLPERLERVRALVRQALIYDDDERLAQRYAERAAEEPWLSHVLAIGRGDCDVINGLGVLILRALGVPARLVIGYVGEDGAVNSGLHAWVEYHDRGWQTLDLTQTTRAAQPAASPVPVVAHAAAPPPAVAITAPAPPNMPTPDPAIVPAPPGDPGAHLPSSPSVDTAAIARPDDRMDAQASTVPSAGPPPRSSPGLGAAVVERWRSLPARRVAQGLTAVLIAGGVVLLLRARRRHWARVERQGRSDSDARILSHMLQSALLHPAAWSRTRDLFHAQALPLLGGGHLSLRQAEQLARARRLFVGRRGAALVDAALDAGERVLDAGHPEFGPVVRMLDGAVDLERLSALQPLRPDQVSTPELLALRDQVQAQLQRAGLARIPLHFVASARAGSFSDVDLERLRLPASGPWPRRYIAIDVDDRFWLACAGLHQRAPARACYLVLHHLLRVSLFTWPLEQELRRHLSRALLAEVAA